MLETTPQERMALMVLALLLTTGGIARHVAYRADLQTRLAYTAEAADSLHSGSDSALRRGVEEELERERIRNRPLEPGERIDPNTASADELQRLPRVGPALAERIISYRNTNGSFRHVQDLGAVQGIGPAVLSGLEPHLEIPWNGMYLPAGPISDDRVDINRAIAGELETLPGIGPAIADRIIQYRRENGPFRSFDDLENVSGIGPRLRERLEDAALIRP